LSVSEMIRVRLKPNTTYARLDLRTRKEPQERRSCGSMSAAGYALQRRAANPRRSDPP
jgi:hypothetical protein